MFFIRFNFKFVIFAVNYFGDNMKLDMEGLFQQVQKMQQEMERLKSEMASKTVVGESGGGMVSVTMNGASKVLAIKIAPELINPEEIDILEDLIVAAVNKANDKAADLVSNEMNKFGGMLPNIPGLNLGF